MGHGPFLPITPDLPLPMRILYHHRTASKDGQAVHIEEMIEALRAQGHQVRMVAPGAGEVASASVGQMGGDVSWVHRLKAHLPKAIDERYNLFCSPVPCLKSAWVSRCCWR